MLNNLRKKLILNCYPMPYTNSDRAMAYRHRLQRHLRALKQGRKAAFPLPIRKI